MKTLLATGVLFTALAFQFCPREVDASAVLRGGQCTPGPSPCRATNAVNCYGDPSCTGNWDECLIGDENEPYSCYGPGGLNDNGGPPTHCGGVNCQKQCSEMCLDAQGNAAGDINMLGAE